MGVRILRIALPAAALVFVVWLNWPQGDGGRAEHRETPEAPADAPLIRDLFEPEADQRPLEIVDAAGRRIEDAQVTTSEDGETIVRCVGFHLERAWHPERITLRPAKTVRGRVTGAPAVVRIWDLDEDDEIDLPQRTDEDGRFELTGIREGYPFLVMAISDGCMPVQTVRTDRTMFELRLGEGATISGRVIDDVDRPVADAEVYVSEDGVEPPWDRPRIQSDYEQRQVFAMGRSRTGPDGAYEVKGLKPGAYRVFAMTAGARGATQRMEVERDTIAHVRVAQLGTLQVSVVGPDGKKLQGWRAVADGPQYEQFFEPTQQLQAGVYKLEVSCGDFQRYRGVVEIVPGETKRVDVALRRGVPLTGIAVDAAGTPLADVTVTTDHRQSALTGADGRFRIEGARDGLVILRAESERHYEYVRELTLPMAEPVRIDLEQRGSLVVTLDPVPKKVRIEMAYAGGGSSTRRETEGDGRVVVWDPGDQGPYQISLEFGEYAPIVLNAFEFKRGQVIDLGTRKLDQGVTLRGQVVDVAGVPIAGVAVEVREPVYRVGVRTDRQGRYEYARLPRELLYVRVIARGFPTTHWKVDPTRPEVTITLRKGGEIRGRVLDLRGKPVPKCRFVFFVADRSGWWEVEADAMGRFSVLVPAGRLRCRVYGEHRQELEQIITVEAGQVTQTELRLR